MRNVIYYLMWIVSKTATYIPVGGSLCLVPSPSAMRKSAASGSLSPERSRSAVDPVTKLHTRLIVKLGAVTLCYRRHSRAHLVIQPFCGAARCPTAHEQTNFPKKKQLTITRMYIKIKTETIYATVSYTCGASSVLVVTESFFFLVSYARLICIPSVVLPLSIEFSFVEECSRCL